MSVVVRFAPSPTGFVHVGTARTALFNWLFARHHGGTFALRIEDTDRERSTPEYVQAIYDGLRWFGLDWDIEVPSQFARRDRHAEVAHELLRRGKAYYCYCTPEELEVMREEARAEGRAVAYDRRWRDRDPSEAPAGVKPVIRVKAPLTGESVVEDQVQGTVRVENTQLDDFIILRSDGTPTYMLSVVVDDHDMGVTHIIRGDDHLNNAFRQKVLIEAMDWPVPIYAHLPLIHGPDGAKFSKRHGAQSVEEYRDMGYLPEALRNYLLRLGWSHGNDEIMSTEQAIAWFDLDGLGKSASRFDFAKLESVNAHYLHEADDARLLDLVTPFLEKELGHSVSPVARERLMAGMQELKTRAKTLGQLAEEGAFYARECPFPYHAKAEALLGAEATPVLSAIAEGLRGLAVFDAAGIEGVCRSVAETLADGKLGKVAMPLRAALTGTTVSPSIFHAAEILGQAETLKRLDHAITFASQQIAPALCVDRSCAPG